MTTTLDILNPTTAPYTVRLGYDLFLVSLSCIQSFESNQAQHTQLENSLDSTSPR